MDKYIGTKLIEAEPAFRVSNEGEKPKIVTDFGEAKEYQVVDMGYRVRYADGYESWSPKDVFERAYMKLTLNPGQTTDKTSISQEMVDDFIVGVKFIKKDDMSIVVRAVLRNGFEITESYDMIAEENYDEKLGADICMKKIKDKVWFLLGFLLQTAVHGVDGAEEKDETVQDKARSGMSFGQAIEAMKAGKKVARGGWNGKGMFLYYVPEGRYPARTDAAKSIAAEDDKVDYGAYIAMKTAQGNVVPWLASQTDMLAEDWAVVW